MLGDSWIDLGTPNAACTMLECFCFLGQNPADEGIVLAGAKGGGRWFRSTNYGLTWVDQGSAPSPELSVNVLVSLGNGIVVGGLGVGDSDVIRSTNWGTSFVFITELDSWQTSVWGGAYCGSDIVLLGTSGFSRAQAANVFRSADGGLSWDAGTTISSGIDSCERIRYLGGGIVVAGTTSHEIARSVNSGANWTINVKNIGEQVHALVNLGGGIVLCGSDQGKIWRSANYGLTWVQIVDIGIAIECFAYGNGMLFMGLSGVGDGRVYRSTDRGYNWTDLGILVPGINKVRSLIYFESSSEKIVLAGLGDVLGDAHILRATEAITVNPPDTLLCEQVKNPTNVSDPQPEFSAIYRYE